MKYKNTVLLLVSLLFFAYAAMISIVPSMKTSSFNTEEFEKKFEEATSLVTSVDSVRYEVTPTLKTKIKVRNLSLKYVDYQPLLDVRHAELTAGIGALFGTKYDIKSLSLKGVKYSDQILPSGDNKIAFLPLAFDSTKFGHKSIAVSPGPVVIKDYKIDYITPTTFAQKKYDIMEYSKDEVEDFLKSFDYAHVKIK